MHRGKQVSKRVCHEQGLQPIQGEALTYIFSCKNPGLCMQACEHFRPCVSGPVFQQHPNNSIPTTATKYFFNRSAVWCLSCSTAPLPTD